MLVLQPFIQPDLGIVMFKPGKTLLDELAELTKGNRLMILPLPEQLVNVPSGKVNLPELPDSSSALMEDDRLLPFFQHADVQRKLGGDFMFWLERIPHCQLSDGGYCDKNLTICSYEQGGAVRTCWHHDNIERSNPSELGIKQAQRNLMHWALERIAHRLHLPTGHPLTLPELCWWSALNDVHDLLPTALVEQMLNRTATSKRVMGGAKKDTDQRFMQSPDEVLNEYVRPIKKLDVDVEPPAMFMARPKEPRWESEPYLKFVRSLPCVVTGKTTDVVAHHLIGHGEGVMGSKAHDLLTFPLTTEEHTKFHNDPTDWEAKHGSQLFWVKQTISKALGLGALV